MENDTRQKICPPVVVVTGASAGVGRAIVRRFAREGAAIGLLARGLDGLEAARQEVEDAAARPWSCPLTSPMQTRSNGLPQQWSNSWDRSMSGSTMRWSPCSPQPST
jgi:NADP-dependent 3-hydroxy acid dehydrogenase YdfG